MLTQGQTSELSDEVTSIFRGLDLDHVTGIFAVQMAMLVCQRFKDAEGATEVLD